LKILSFILFFLLSLQSFGQKQPQFTPKKLPNDSDTILFNIYDYKELIGKWRRVIKGKQIDLTDKSTHIADLIFNSDSTFFIKGDTTKSTTPGWHFDSQSGTWSVYKNKYLTFSLEPKEQHIKYSVTIVRVNAIELVVKFANSKPLVTYLRL